MGELLPPGKVFRPCFLIKSGGVRFPSPDPLRISERSRVLDRGRRTGCRVGRNPGSTHPPRCSSPIHNGTQCIPHEPVVVEWLFLPQPIYRQGVFLRFGQKTPLPLKLPTLYPKAVVNLLVRSEDDVSRRVRNCRDESRPSSTAGNDAG